MTTPAWPGTLPDFLVGDSLGELAENVLRTQTAAGPARTRRRTAANTAPRKESVLVDAAGETALKTFFNDTLEGGALEFTKVDGASGDTETLRFTGAPKYKRGGSVWPWRLYDLELELMP